MDFRTIKFAKDHNEEFYKVLRQRVSDYFKINNITRHANAKMVVKTICMFLLYFVPFVLFRCVILCLCIGGRVGVQSFLRQQPLARGRPGPLSGLVPIRLTAPRARLAIS